MDVLESPLEVTELMAPMCSERDIGERGALGEEEEGGEEGVPTVVVGVGGGREGDMRDMGDMGDVPLVGCDSASFLRGDRLFKDFDDVSCGLILIGDEEAGGVDPEERVTPPD